VLATDTQYTRGQIRSHGPKLFPFFTSSTVVERPDLSVLVTGAGNVPFMRRAVSLLESKLASVVDLTLDEVRVLTENALVEFYQTHIYPKPASKQDVAGFDLILGVWTKRDGFGLFTTSDTVVNPVAQHGTAHCSIGTGTYVTDYSLGLTWQAGLSVEHAKFLAAFSIKAAKDHVNSCGGDTIIWTIKNDGSSHRVHRVMGAEVKIAEQGSVDLYDTLGLLLTFLDIENVLDDDSVQYITDVVRDTVVDFRKKQRERRDKIKKARENAGKMRDSLTRLRQQQSEQTP
jgi:hypothetical protein